MNTQRHGICRRRFVAGSLASVVSCLAAGPASAAADDLFTAGLILGPGPAGRCDDYRLGGPVVRRDEDAGLWRMWYYGRDSQFPSDIAPNFGTGCIATAVSRDGYAWQRVDGPLRGGAVLAPAADPGAFDARHVATGDVLRHGDEWLMAYFGGNDERPSGTHPMFDARGYVLHPGIARSTDGLNWRRVDGGATGGAALDIEPGDVYSAFPGLLHDGERFLLYYTTADRAARYWRQKVASSPDGTSWTRLGELRWLDEPAAFDSGGIISRDILRNPLDDGPRWLMVYTAKDGRDETGARRSIGVAVSDDAITWRRLLREPVFVTGPRGAWDHAGVAVPRLVVSGRELRLYYYGWSNDTFAGHPQRGIGCAVADIDTPWRFRRYRPERGTATWR